MYITSNCVASTKLFYPKAHFLDRSSHSKKSFVDVDLMESYLLNTYYCLLHNFLNAMLGAYDLNNEPLLLLSDGLDFFRLRTKISSSFKVLY